VKRKRFQKITNSSGQEFYQVPFSLRASVINEVLNFELLFEGKSYGSAVTKFV
jgi:hypothetical protein